jgi:hypothetical protein
VIPATLRRRCRETANGFSAKAYLRETHIFHADIALHKSARPSYIPHIKAATAVSAKAARGVVAARTSEGPEPTARRNSKQHIPPPIAVSIALATLLLPVANHLNDARRTSSPGGRFLLHLRSNHHASGATRGEVAQY